MDKNIKITLGCFGSITFVTGWVIGGIMQYKHDNKILKKYKNELTMVHKDNEQLKIRILSKRR